MNPFVSDLISTMFTVVVVISALFGLGFWIVTSVEIGSRDYEKRYKRVRIVVSVFLVIIISIGVFCFGISRNVPEANYVYFSTQSNVYHYYGCKHIEQIKSENLQHSEESDFFDSNNDPFGDGTYYRGCSSCSKDTGNLARYKEAKHGATVWFLLIGGVGGAVCLYAFIQDRRSR